MKLRFISKLQDFKSDFKIKMQEYERKYKKEDKKTPILIDPELSSEEKKRLNYLYNTIIRKIYKKLNKENANDVSFSDYMYSNELCERIFNIKEQKYIRNYLTRYFSLRQISVLSRINKTYNALNNIIEEIEYITESKIKSYDDLLFIGNLYYETPFKKNTTKQTNSIIDNKKSIISNKNIGINPIKKEEVIETNKIKPKKEIISTDELNNLKSTYRKLCNKIKKLDKNLNEITDLNKKNYLNHEILICKLQLKSLEDEMLKEKQSNEIFDKTIINNYDIRYEKSLKCIDSYIRKYNNKSISCTIEEYFGLDQLNYFNSLGIDVDSIIQEKIKRRKSK